MSKKLIIFLVIDVIVIASLIITNNVIGARVASSVDEQLQIIFTEAEATDNGLNFEYDEVTANPFGRSVTISGFKTKIESFFPTDMEAQSVKLKMPLSEILGLARNKELKSINKMSIDIQNPVFKSEETQARFLAKSMKVTFKGEASLFELERMDKGFLPSTKQSLDINFQDMGWEGLEDLFATLPDEVQSTLGTTYNESGDYRLTIDFDPYKKQINLKRLNIDSKATSISAQMLFNFTGESFEDFEPKDGHVQIDYALNKLSESLPEWGEYNIKKVNAHFEMDLDFDINMKNILSNKIFQWTSIQNLSYSMSVDGLKLEPSEGLTDIFSQFGTTVELDVFAMKKMAIDFEMKNGTMNLKNLTLKVEDQVDIQGSAKMVYQVLPNQGLFGVEKEVLIFENAHIEIVPQSADGDGFIQAIEELMPKPFPRENGKIIIDLSGPVSNPTIKGVTD